MTRQERIALCDLSLKVLGSKYAWQKMLRKGEMVSVDKMSNNGQLLKVKTTKHFTVDDVLKIIQDKIEEKNKKEGSNGTKESVSNTENRESQEATGQEGQSSQEVI